jgi:hypothetical protein
MNISESLKFYRKQWHKVSICDNKSSLFAPRVISLRIVNPGVQK